MKQPARHMILGSVERAVTSRIDAEIRYFAMQNVTWMPPTGQLNAMYAAIQMHAAYCVALMTGYARR
jgi:hypothetical protein